MKANFLFVLFAAFILASSCKKQNVQPAAAAPSILLGKWSIAKDSSSNEYSGSLYSNVYVGTLSDYYDFRADGKCYVHKNGVFDTLAYKIIADTSVAFANQYPSIIRSLTSHSARISLAAIQPPGMGYDYSETLFLTK